MKRVNRVLFYFSLFLGLNSNAQCLRFERYTTKDGLLSDEVYNLHQDRQGYIWVFTEYGAMKYNGKEFKPVLKNLPFNDAFIYSIYENQKGQKWVANSNAKIYEVLNDAALPVKGTEKASEHLCRTVQEIMKVYVDGSLNIYALTKHETYQFVYKQKWYQPVNLHQVMADSRINFKILENGNTLLPIVTHTGEGKVVDNSPFKDTLVLQFEGRGNRSVYVPVSFPTNRSIRHLKQYGADIFFCINDCLYKLRNRKQLSAISLDFRINNFTRDHKNHLWVALFNGGLVELNENDSIVNRYLPGTIINDVLIDSENGLWVSSFGSGLYHCQNINTMHFNEQEPLGHSISFIKAIDGKLFIATMKGEIYVEDKEELTLVKKTFAKPTDLIKSRGNYLLFSYDKMEELKISSSYQNAVGRSLNGLVNAIKAVDMGDSGLLYCKRLGLGYIKGDKVRKVLTGDQKLLSYERMKEHIYFATGKGVYELSEPCRRKLFDPGDTTRLAILDLVQPGYLYPTQNSRIQKIVKDELGNVWFCSIGNGLFKLTPGLGLSHFTTRNGLPSNIINGINFNKDGTFLLSTNQGLFVSGPSALDFEKRTWETLYPEAVQEALVFHDKVYVTTSSGLVILEHKRKREAEKAYFNLVSVRVNSTERDTALLRALRYDQNTIEFGFDLIAFSSNKKQVSYHLSGPVSDQGHLLNGQVKFQHLPPGKYVLTLIPDAYSALKLQIPFVIIAAFWQTAPFIIAVILAIFLLFFILVRSVITYQKKKETKRLEAEKLIAEYKLIALKAQMNPHFLSNSLSAIQNLVYSGSVDKAGDYLAKFSVLLRRILNYSEKHYLTLAEETQIIKLYVELEQLRFKNNFNFELNVDPGIPLNEALVPSLITQPFIENAIWHGLLTLTERDPKLVVNIYRKDLFVYIIIEDNGVGRDGSTVLESSHHKGTQLVISRMEGINQISPDTSNKVEIIDVFDENGRPAGTKVILQLTYYTLDE